MLATVAGCSSRGEDKYLALDGSKVCFVFTPEQILDYGVGRVSNSSIKTGPDNAFSGCVWSSGPSSYDEMRGLTVTFDTEQLNHWVGERDATEPVAGYRASLTGGGTIMAIAAGPDFGVLTIRPSGARKPVREIAEAAVARLRK